MQKSGYLLLGGLVVILALAAAVFYQYRPVTQPANTESLMQKETVSSSPAATVVDQQSGEVDQTAFEKEQQVSKDTSLTTIDTELNNTVILQEDFSDL